MTTAVLRTSHLVVGGAALAREDSGRVVFVSGALADETVEVSFSRAKKDFAAAEVVEVLEPSPHRVVPACEAWHRGCGGCDWQHIAPVAQLDAKVDIVREALSRTGRLVDPVVTAGGTVPAWGYRTTVRLAVDHGAVGFRSRRSHRVVPIRRCPVAAAAVNEEIGALADILGASRPASGPTAEVVVRASAATGERNRSDRPDDAHLSDVVAGATLRVSVGSFFQSSPEAAELLVAAVRRAAADVDIASVRVIDAYGGIGLFAATVAAGAAHVVLIEASPSACADARVNLADRAAAIVEARVEDWEPMPAGLVIADPARSGLDKAAAAVLAASGAPVIVVVSCDTGSLARDVRVLGELGYAHDGTEVIDTFPNTSHIETVTRFVAAAGAS